MYGQIYGQMYGQICGDRYAEKEKETRKQMKEKRSAWTTKTKPSGAGTAVACCGPLLLASAWN
jgi:hypothetical protein